ncbi:MAG: N-acetylmuramoyl-L-alanine amidase [Myxococcota bacterium]|nr:N-acetylmuramoyl-L-alanine amidase [Myxococcota bacterium]
MSVITGLTEIIILAGVMGMPTVVLDPGHGGPHAGAVSASGTVEKDVALRVSKYARQTLEKEGYRVLLTRDKDKYIRLRNRTSFANRNKADVFVSVHANSSPAEARRGSETYVLSAIASEDVSASKVRLENEEQDADKVLNEEEFGGGKRAHKAIDGILRDLKKDVSHKRSARLAKAIQESLSTVPALTPSRGLRQAPFLVLKGARMPAVLVEIGYLTHAVQGRQLATRETQRAAGRAIALGIISYLSQEKE